MQEMDLDELDQAVNKLMVQATKGKAAKKADDTKPADTSTPVAVKTDDKSDKPADKPADNSGPVVVRRATQIMPRKNGIAMDIVQPKPAAVTPPSAKAARIAPTLQPTKLVEPEEPKEEPKKADDKPADTPAPAPREASAPPKEDNKEVSDDTLASLDMQVDGKPKADLLNDPDHEAHKSVWPDPLDVHGFKADDDAKSVNGMSTAEPKVEEGKTMEHGGKVIAPPTDTAKDEAQEDGSKAEDADKPAEEKPDETPSTPFVDAKVEKRPLGAYADTASEAKPEEKPAETTEPKADDSPKDDSKTDPASIAVQTPKELSPEVVAVESAEPEFVPGAPKIEGDETDMNNLRQMSIPQQYEGKDKKPSDKDRPIFDTKDYHPALKPNATAHKSSKAGTVVTIILILLMVGAAAVAYFTITGTLDITKLL